MSAADLVMCMYKQLNAMFLLLKFGHKQQTGRNAEWKVVQCLADDGCEKPAPPASPSYALRTNESIQKYEHQQLYRTTSAKQRH